MKNGLNKKIFEDKELLQKNLPKYLKKTTLALANKKVPELPFYYEGNHFEDGAAFITIGVTKDIHKLFKQERVKGKGGKDEQGKIIKLDKKLVAFGKLLLNKEGQYEFQIEQGFLKKQHLKASINGVTILKQTIGQNFLITKGGTPVEEEEQGNSSTATTPKAIQQEWIAQKTKMKATLMAMKSNLEKLQANLG